MHCNIKNCKLPTKKIRRGMCDKHYMQWCDEYNIRDTTFHNRLRRGWIGIKLLKPPNSN